MNLDADNDGDFDFEDVSKWIGTSLTMWGLVVTFLSTVLPMVARVLGHDWQVGNVVALGNAGNDVLNAAGGLVGSVMVFWGRLRAFMPLNWVGK